MMPIDRKRQLLSVPVYLQKYLHLYLDLYWTKNPKSSLGHFGSGLFHISVLDLEVKFTVIENRLSS